MNDSQTMVRTLSTMQVVTRKACIGFRRNVWQTPISRHAIPETKPATPAARESIIPVWVYVAVRRILGQTLYNRIKSALRGER